MEWLLKKYMVKNQIRSFTDLAKATGIKRCRLYKRINEPKTILIFELEALDSVLHFEDEDLVKLIRGEI